MAMSMGSKAHKITRALPPVLFAATVATQLPAVVAAKFNPNVPLFPDKYVYTLSRFFGPDLTKKLVGPTYTGNFAPSLAQSPIQPFGWANATTFGGALILIVDYAVKHFGIVPHYGSFGPSIRAVGAGLIVSGVVGGILDPPAGTGGPGSSRSSSISGISLGGPSGFAQSNIVGSYP